METNTISSDGPFQRDPRRHRRNPNTAELGAEECAASFVGSIDAQIPINVG